MIADRDKNWQARFGPSGPKLDLKQVVFFFCHFPVLQIGDFQMVGQLAESLKGILRPQLVQERCIFLLLIRNKNGENGDFYITSI